MKKIHALSFNNSVLVATQCYVPWLNLPLRNGLLWREVQAIAADFLAALLDQVGGQTHCITKKPKQSQKL
jgi:hypothetical protein